MKRYTFPVLALVLALALSSGCIIVTDDASLTVANDSSFVITELYVTPVGDDPRFSADLLGSGFLRPGESIVIDVECGFYDVEVVDELGALCLLPDLDLCFDDALWVIDDRELNRCAF